MIWSVFIYGLFMIGLGYLGYQGGHSKISLYMGLGMGGVLLVSCALMLSGRVVGAYLALAMTALLTATFAYRYTVSHKSIPAILAVFSGGMLLFLLSQMGKWRK